MKNLVRFAVLAMVGVAVLLSGCGRVNDALSNVDKPQLEQQIKDKKNAELKAAKTYFWVDRVGLVQEEPNKYSGIIYYKALGGGTSQGSVSVTTDKDSYLATFGPFDPPPPPPPTPVPTATLLPIQLQVIGGSYKIELLRGQPVSAVPACEGEECKVDATEKSQIRVAKWTLQVSNPSTYNVESISFQARYLAADGRSVEPATGITHWAGCPSGAGFVRLKGIRSRIAAGANGTLTIYDLVSADAAKLLRKGSGSIEVWAETATAATSGTSATSEGGGAVARVAFDIPALIGRNIDQVAAALGNGDGNNEREMASQGEDAATWSWTNSDGHGLMAVYRISTRRVTSFLLDSPVGPTQDTDYLYALGNLQRLATSYSSLPIPAADEPGYFTGVKVTPLR